MKLADFAWTQREVNVGHGGSGSAILGGHSFRGSENFEKPAAFWMLLEMNGLHMFGLFYHAIRSFDNFKNLRIVAGRRRRDLPGVPHDDGSDDFKSVGNTDVLN